jgi:2'-hydroxyisoflavone reductase
VQLLIIGGTLFLGRAIVETTIQGGHQVTLFNRGKSNSDIFPQIEHLVGDRDGGLDVLRGRRWDSVIDTCGYIPRVVGDSTALLADRVGQYVFISSISVYAGSQSPGLDETAPLGVLEDESVEDVTGVTYGPLKALCEKTVQANLPGRSLIIRPGLIVGPHDRSDRFTYWPYRISRGGLVLAPGRPERGIQFIDVRDLADWIVQMVVNKRMGVFNAISPPGVFTMGGLLAACEQTSEKDVEFIWVDDDFLIEQDVGAWVELPLWIPESEPDAAGFFSFSVARALEAGLRFRPILDTVLDTLGWSRGRPDGYTWRAGLTQERERELLETWRGRNDSK